MPSVYDGGHSLCREAYDKGRLLTFGCFAVVVYKERLVAFGEEESVVGGIVVVVFGRQEQFAVHIHKAYVVIVVFYHHQVVFAVKDAYVGIIEGNNYLAVAIDSTAIHHAVHLLRHKVEVLLNQKAVDMVDAGYEGLARGVDDAVAEVPFLLFILRVVVQTCAVAHHPVVVVESLYRAVETVVEGNGQHLSFFFEHELISN